MTWEPAGEDLPFKPACALVDAGRARGSGFLATPTAVLTCHHVIRHQSPGAPLQVRFAHGSYAASVDLVDEAQDLAVLRLEREVAAVAPLLLATEPPASGAAFASYGFPSATLASGLALRGHVHDLAGEDLAGRRSLVLFSQQITAGAALQGFSGSPVMSGGRVVGQLRQIVPDPDRGAQFGLVFACPAAVLAGLVPELAAASQASTLAPQPPGCAYDPRWYVARPYEERRALGRLSVRGGAVVLQGPPGAGKTWLMQHLLQRESPHSAVVPLSLHALSTAETAASYGGFLRELARRLVHEALALDAATTTAMIDETWTFSQDPVSNLSHLLSRRVLPSFSEQRKLILAIDDADALSARPYAQEFFSLLRAWMDASHKAPWSALRLLMSLTRSPDLLIQDPNRSPFNIAQTLLVRDLSPEQVGELAARHSVRFSDPELRALMDLVGGHPYLLRLVMYESQLAQKPLRELLSPASALFEDFLRESDRRLRKVPGLRQAFLRVLADPAAPLTEAELEHLFCLGLLVDDGTDAGLRARCSLLHRLVRGRP